MIGHYTDVGQNIRERILDDSALSMFWFIDEKNAFGGRAALLPLLKAVIFSKKRGTIQIKIDDTCNKNCKTAFAVFTRSASLLSHSKKIDL